MVVLFLRLFTPLSSKGRGSAYKNRLGVPTSKAEMVHSTGIPHGRKKMHFEGLSMRFLESNPKSWGGATPQNQPMGMPLFNSQ